MRAMFKNVIINSTHFTLSTKFNSIFLLQLFHSIISVSHHHLKITHTKKKQSFCFW